MRHLTEANPANSKAAHIAAWATAAIATVLDARLQHWLGIQSFGLGNLTFLRHVLPLFTEY